MGVFCVHFFIFSHNSNFSRSFRQFSGRRQFGESYGDKGDPVLVVLSLFFSPSLRVLDDIPVSPAQPVFLPDGRLIFAGATPPSDDHLELGFQYCLNRPYVDYLCS